MSISICNLHRDEREVGKTIKGTKKYYLWEFVLNGKFHKVEMFHSKMSGKKKVVLDAQVLVEDKSYSSSFQYSFKIDKHYFNVIQNSVGIELRIDNRTFENLMSDEKAGRLKPVEKKRTHNHNDDDYVKKARKAYGYEDYYSQPYKANTNFKKSDDLFFKTEEDEDFDFSGGKSNKAYGFNVPQPKKEKTESHLLNMDDIMAIKNAQTSSNSRKTTENQMKVSQETFQKNQNILDGLNIFGENDGYKPSNDSSGVNILSMNIFGNNNPQGQVQNQTDFRGNFQQPQGGMGMMGQDFNSNNYNTVNTHQNPQFGLNNNQQYNTASNYQNQQINQSQPFSGNYPQEGQNDGILKYPSLHDSQQPDFNQPNQNFNGNFTQTNPQMGLGNQQSFSPQELPRNMNQPFGQASSTQEMPMNSNQNYSISNSNTMGQQLNFETQPMNGPGEMNNQMNNQMNNNFDPRTNPQGYEYNNPNNFPSQIQQSNPPSQNNQIPSFSNPATQNRQYVNTPTDQGEFSGQNQNQPPQQEQQQDDFKNKILGTGLVNLDNLLNEHQYQQTNNNYNFNNQYSTGMNNSQPSEANTPFDF